MILSYLNVGIVKIHRRSKVVVFSIKCSLALPILFSWESGSIVFEYGILPLLFYSLLKLFHEFNFHYVSPVTKNF